MKKLLFLLLLSLPILSLEASDIIIDGIHYQIIDSYNKKCEVVKDTENSGIYTDSNYSGLIVIPSTIIVDDVEYVVTKIDKYAFYRSKISFISLPNTIESIGEHAFDGCNSLEKIILPGKIDQISKYCFAGCANLKSIEIPDGIKYINEGAFEYSGLKSINLPNSVISIGDFSFSDAKSLESINIPDNCSNLGVAVLRNSPAMNTINISDNHPYFILSDNILYTKDYSTIRYCLPSFSGKLIINKNTSVIDGSAFSYCSKITEIEFNDGLELIKGGAFSYCTSLQEIILPKGLESLGGSVFEGCSSLHSVLIPNTVREIGSFCFDLTNLSEITIPSSVEKIGTKAFYQCYNLTKVNVRAINPPDRDIYLFPLGKTMEIHVLKGYKSAYESNSNWNKNANIYDDLDPIKVEKIKIAKDQYYININETKRASVIFYPDDADAKIIWSSSNESIVYIDKEGSFIGITEGEAEIIAKSADDENIKASAKVQVGKFTGIYSSTIQKQDNSKVVGIYDLNGKKTNINKQGIYIIRKSDGTTQKIFVR